MEPVTQKPELQAVLAGAPLSCVVPVTTAEVMAIGTAAYQFLEQGRREKARNAFSALIQLAPERVLGYFGLGSLALAERQLEEAQELLTKAASLFQNDAHIYATLGEVKLRLGEREEALTLLGKAVDLDPLKQHPAANRARAILAGVEDAEKQQAAGGTAANV